MTTLIFLLLAATGLTCLTLVLVDWYVSRRAWRDVEAHRLDFEFVASKRLLIAHAAGGSAMGSYPNAIECLDQWYAQGIRYFEFDLQPTPDGGWIGLHDWGPTLRRWFDLSALPLQQRLLRALRPRSALPAKSVLALPMRGNLTVLTPQRLATWLEAHPDAWLVTDIKSANRQGLEVLAQVLGQRVRQVVAQVFAIEEIELARRLGYGRVAWANYVPKWPLKALPDRLGDFSLDLVVLDQRKLALPQDLPHLDALIRQGREIWVFTVNDCQRLEELPEAISGVITDRLLPANTEK
ncbi:MAG: hypothetical protein EA370_09865 [Wenzhouxiangella sp.]|nr:MAG: hypothetical protein EA370_09865 [Wenzhouxiangella sp.]